ncbi:MAG: phosphatidate cytidylyltransferase [Anaerolineae bacterium]|nr:phosphatidate cytidylyltransferase [Anaerolineae bacterium]
MTQGDIIGLILSYVYAFGMLLGVEAVGKSLQWPQSFTRKIIHIGAGMWVWGILYFFDHWYFGIVPFATFVVLNYLFYRRQTFKAMDTGKSTPGTVYFAASITLLYGLLWRTGGTIDYAPIATASVMAMTWGDAMASIVGVRWGRHQYTILGHTRSWEGSAAMAILSFLVMLGTLAFLPGSMLSPNSIAQTGVMLIVMSMVGTIVATLAEGLSPAGTDNLSVPLLTGLVLWLVRLIVP